jgi:hypothetical protein
MKSPKHIDDFLEKLSVMRKIKKANNLYFEEIETDIIKKERFVQEQIK